MPLDHFDLIAGLYDRAAPFTLSEPLVGLLSLSSDTLLLDVGGGTGRIAAALRSAVREVVVVDLSHGMLCRAAKKGLESVRTPAEHLPFSARTFSRIIMVDALHHVADQAQAVSELWRVLSPAGRLLIVEPDIRHFAVKLIALAEKILLMRSHILIGKEIAALVGNQSAFTRILYAGYNVFVLSEKVR